MLSPYAYIPLNSIEEFLQDKLKVEADEQLKDKFAKFPFRYAEIAKVLLDV